MNARSKVESRSLVLGLISIIGSGCAAGISNQPHGRAAGEWNVSLPAASSYTQGLAYGRGGSSARVQADADVPLFAEAQPVAGETLDKKPVQRKRRADPQPSGPAQRQQAPLAPPAARHERNELAAFSAPVSSQGGTGQLALADAMQRYEARQAQSQTQQQFQGGDAIVIGASTLVIVLLVVLLLVLLL